MEPFLSSCVRQTYDSIFDDSSFTKLLKTKEHTRKKQSGIGNYWMNIFDKRKTRRAKVNDPSEELDKHLAG